MRLLKCLTLALAVLLAVCPKALAAEEIYEKSGASGLYSALDGDTRDLLDRAGAGGGQVTEFSGEELFRLLSDLVRESIAGPLKALAAILAVVVLTRLCGCFEEGELSGSARLIGAAACAVVMAEPVLGLLSLCRRVTDSAAAFLAVAAPVYAGLLTASGGLATGSGYSFMAMLLGEAIPLLSAGLILPLCRVYLALSIASVLSDDGLTKLTGSIYSFMKWALVTAVTVYAGVLSVQTALNAQVDAAAGKAAKLALSTGVPIVGGALGDAVSAIQNSLRIVRSGAGAFGVLAAVCIFLPAVCQCIAWTGVCLLGQAAGEMFQAGKVSALLGAFTGTVKLVLAVLVSVCAVCVASAAAIVFVNG